MPTFISTATAMDRFVLSKTFIRKDKYVNFKIFIFVPSVKTCLESRKGYMKDKNKFPFRSKYVLRTSIQNTLTYVYTMLKVSTS